MALTFCHNVHSALVLDPTLLASDNIFHELRKLTPEIMPFFYLPQPCFLISFLRYLTGQVIEHKSLKMILTSNVHQ